MRAADLRALAPAALSTMRTSAQNRDLAARTILKRCNHHDDTDAHPPIPYPPPRRGWPAAMNRPPGAASPMPDGVGAGAASRSDRAPWVFSLLLFALSTPLWLLAAVTGLELVPGLSVSVLVALCPMAAALILVWREGRSASALALLRRSFDLKRIGARIWYAPILLLMPGVSVVVYGLMRWLNLPMPAPQVALLPALLAFLALALAGLGEELGWSGYAIGPLLERWNALQAGLMLGAVGAVWHLVPLLLLQRAPTWIAWWFLYALAARVLMVWLYQNTGRSVAAAALFHASLNLAYVLFPVNGSGFDMRLGAMVMALVAAVVTLLWGPRTLAHWRKA